jgi:hypothetical protein
MSGTPAKKAASARPQTLRDVLGNSEEPVATEDPVADMDNHEDTDLDGDDNPAYVEDAKNDPFMSPEVVHLDSNKTPAEMAMETPAETAKRYNIDNEISEADAKNPRVQVYRDTLVNQVPSSTHVHPDVAKDLMNRGIAETHTDNAQVKRFITDTYDFAPDAETQDKYVKPVVEEDDDEDGTHKL